MSIKQSVIITNKKDKDIIEVEVEKSENIVHIDKGGAEELKKLKATLISKKTLATRYMNSFEKRATAFKNSATKHNRDNTQATRIHLQLKAEDVLVSKDKLKKHQDELEKLAEEIKETLEQYPITGANGDEVTTKLETDAFDYVDKIEDTLVDNDVLISEAIVASKPEVISTQIQRNTSTPATITQQGDVFRDVGSLKPSFLEKGSNLMEVSHWIEQARNYIEAGFKDSPPDEGTYKYIQPFIHSFWAGKLAHINPKTQSINTILNTLELEAKKGDPRHNRRLRMIGIRRGSDTHSDFINKLISTLSTNKLISTLFSFNNIGYIGLPFSLKIMSFKTELCSSYFPYLW